MVSPVHRAREAGARSLVGLGLPDCLFCLEPVLDHMVPTTALAFIEFVSLLGNPRRRIRRRRDLDGIENPVSERVQAVRSQGTMRERSLTRIRLTPSQEAS